MTAHRVPAHVLDAEAGHELDGGAGEAAAAAGHESACCLHGGADAPPGARLVELTAAVIAALDDAHDAGYMLPGVTAQATALLGIVAHVASGQDAAGAIAGEDRAAAERLRELFGVPAPQAP